MSSQVYPKDKEILPGLQIEKVDDRIMTLNVGPQHPGSGHMRIILKLMVIILFTLIQILVMYIGEKKRWLSIEII